MEGVLTLEDVDLKGRTVLYRVDVNSPLEPSSGRLLDDGRLRGVVPTLQALEQSKVVIMGHQSRPGKSDFTSMSRHCDRLSEILGRPIKFVPDVCGVQAIEEIENMSDGDVIFLDNVRGNEEEYGVKYGSNEDTEDTDIVTTLSSVSDAFVTDAFAAAHRRSPTLTGFTKSIPCIAGTLMEKEISSLRMALKDPPSPYLAILGGAKCDDSVRVALNLISKGEVDRIAFVGVTGNLMLWIDGNDIGERNREFIRNSLGDDFEIAWEMAEKILSEHPEKAFLPVDVAVESDGRRKPLSIEELPSADPIYDVGIETLRALKPLVEDAGCILWNGPASYFELPEFAFGTIEILNMCTETNAMTIIGGGHTSALVNSRGAANLVSHNSTGGGSTMSFLSGEPMPVIASLKDSCRKHSDDLGSLGLAR
ncbi:MAG: phosphoglycerate kinase [Candidatus Thalassarchaeaceae archaeon]|nr:phosphoglycerate kinase [Candidatus Thalassarchaeaceae archaeon]